MNIEPLKSLCNYTRFDSVYNDTYGYFNNFVVFRSNTATITIFYPKDKDNKLNWNWTYKVFTSPQDALNELIQSISKIKHFQLQSKLDSINKDF